MPPRFPTSAPVRDRILGEEIIMSSWDEDDNGQRWRVLYYSGGWKQWTPLETIAAMFDENRQLDWMSKAFVYRHFY